MEANPRDSLAEVAAVPAILLRIMYQLTCRDAVSLAVASKDIMQTLRAELLIQSAAVRTVLSGVCCPRILIVASGAKKLLEIPIKHDGSLYDCERAVTVVTGRARGKRKCTNKRSLPGSAGWLTGIAVSPDDGRLYVCDYGARGVVKYDPNTLSRQQKFTSAAVLSCPEGIAIVRNQCYVTSISQNIAAAVDQYGKIKQILPLPEGLVPWGMTAWEPEKYSCATKHVAAAGLNGGSGSDTSSSSLACSSAALFIAVDVQYFTKDYTLPPETTTGGVLRVLLSSSGVLLGPAVTYSKAPMKRPSGLTFDSQGHLWVTSAQQQLLLLAGPTHTTPGVLLQTLDLPSFLPQPAKHLYPFDVHAVVKQESALAAAAGIGIQSSSSGSRQLCQGDRTLLVVTLHCGSRERGAVAIFEVSGTQSQATASANCRATAATRTVGTPLLEVGVSENMEKCSADLHQRGPAAAAAEGHGVNGAPGHRCVRLAGFVCGHPALREPNMIAVLT